MKKFINKVLILTALIISGCFCFMLCSIYQGEPVNSSGNTWTSNGSVESIRIPKTVVSLTSYPKRFCVLPCAIKSICCQSIRPDVILINLCESENPDKALIHDVLKENDLDDKVTVNWYKEPIRSYGKLIPALKKYPDDIIITIDDDKEYNENLIEELLAAHNENPTCIVCGICEPLMDNCQVNFSKFDSLLKKGKPHFGALIIGSNGTLYPPHCLSNEVFNSDLYKKIFPTDDDIWFSYCAIISKTSVVKLHNRSEACDVVKEWANDFDIPRLWDSNSQGVTSKNLKKMKEMLEKKKTGVRYYMSAGMQNACE